MFNFHNLLLFRSKHGDLFVAASLK